MIESKQLLTSFLTLGLSAVLTSAQVVLVDFNSFSGAGTTPGTTWNEQVTPDVPNSGINLLDTSGNATGINLSFSGIQNSGSSADQWENRPESPAWATADALFDRLFVGAGNSGTLTLSNLNPNFTYSIELASGWQTGSAARGSGQYVMTDANGPVEGFNALTAVSRGANVMWAANIQGTNAEQGWLGWYNMVPDSNGQIVLSITVPPNTDGIRDDINPRAALNAMQIEATIIPEPSTYAAIFGLLGLGLAFWVRRRRA